jgi:uncharacterized protein YkwD
MHGRAAFAMMTSLVFSLIFSFVASASSGPDLDFIARAQRTAGVKLAADATLSRGAACLAKFSRKGSKLTTQLVRFCADATGVYEAVLVPLVAETGNAQSAEHAVTHFFANEGKTRALTHYGAANARDDKTQTVAVLGSLRRGTFDVQASDLCAQKKARFSGEVSRGHDHVKALLTPPAGKVVPVALELNGRSYQGEAPLEVGPGRYQLEVLAETKDGPHVVANRTLFVCVKPPTEPPESYASSAPPKEAQVVALINADRKKAGLHALKIDPDLSAVAEMHAFDMHSNRFFAHNGKDGSTLADRMKRGDVGFVRATENLSSAPSAEDAHASLMGSPGHRKNILDPEVTHVGVGIVSAPLSNGEPNYIFVIDFMTGAETADPTAFKKALLTTLNQERASAKLPPVQLDPALSELAERHSRAMVAHDALAYVPSEDQFFADVRARKGNVHADADLFVTNDPSALRKSQHIKQSARAIGVGAALGSSKRYGNDVYFVTVIYQR